MELGKPAGRLSKRTDGGCQREFENGTVIYNHFQNGTITLEFKEARKRLSDGRVAKGFAVSDTDGDIFLYIK